MTPYNVIQEYQRLASSIAFATDSAPAAHVTPDGSAISYKEHTLHVPVWRHAIAKLQQDIEDDLAALLKTTQATVTVPQDVPDDWTETLRGYSWLKNGQFVKEERPLVSALIKDPMLGICTVDRNESLVFNTSAMLKVMESAATINRKLSCLAYIVPGGNARMA